MVYRCDPDRFSLLHAIAITHLRREVQLRKFTTAAVLNRTDEPDKYVLMALKCTVTRCDGTRLSGLTRDRVFWQM